MRSWSRQATKLGRIQGPVGASGHARWSRRCLLRRRHSRSHKRHCLVAPRSVSRALLDAMKGPKVTRPLTARRCGLGSPSRRRHSAEGVWNGSMCMRSCQRREPAGSESDGGATRLPRRNPGRGLWLVPLHDTTTCEPIQRSGAAPDPVAPLPSAAVVFVASLAHMYAFLGLGVPFVARGWKCPGAHRMSGARGRRRRTTKTQDRDLRPDNQSPTLFTGCGVLSSLSVLPSDAGPALSLGRMTRLTKARSR